MLTANRIFINLGPVRCVESLQVFGLYGLQHPDLAQHAVGFYGVVQLCGVKPFEGDVGEHHAIAPGESQLACGEPSGTSYQSR
jgi:hypothetical protein